MNSTQREVSRLKEELLDKKSICIKNGEGIEVNIFINRVYASVDDINFNCISFYTKSVHGRDRLYLICLNFSDMDTVIEYFISNDSFNLESLNFETLNYHQHHNRTLNELLLKSKYVRSDLGIVARLELDEYVLMWDIKKQLHIFDCGYKDYDVTDVTVRGITLSHNINNDCVVEYEGSLFALSSNGDKLYYVPNNWNDHSKKVYSQHNTQPKFLTFSYTLEKDESDNYNIAKKNEGFIDFQSMVNTEILQLFDPIETMVDKKIKEAFDKKRFF